MMTETWAAVGYKLDDVLLDGVGRLAMSIVLGSAMIGRTTRIFVTISDGQDL